MVWYGVISLCLLLCVSGLAHSDSGQRVEYVCSGVLPQADVGLSYISHSCIHIAHHAGSDGFSVVDSYPSLHDLYGSAHSQRERELCSSNNLWDGIYVTISSNISTLDSPEYSVERSDMSMLLMYAHHLKQCSRFVVYIEVEGTYTLESNQQSLNEVRNLLETLFDTVHLYEDMKTNTFMLVCTSSAFPLNVAHISHSGASDAASSLNRMTMYERHTVDIYSPWRHKLYTPTQLMEYNGVYFIVDCWHNRVLVSESINRPVHQWYVLDNDLGSPHSIAFDPSRQILVTEDNRRSSSVVYSFHRNSSGECDFNGGCLRRTQVIPLELSKRPHFTTFVEFFDSFFVIGAHSAPNSSHLYMTQLRANGGIISVVAQQELDFLQGNYTRSFTTYGPYFYFAKYKSVIICSAVKNNINALNVERFLTLRSIHMPTSLFNLNYIHISSPTKAIYITATHLVGSESYISSFPGVICVIVHGSSTCQDVTEHINVFGTPYYLSVSRLDSTTDRIIVPEITESSGIVSFTEVYKDSGLALSGVVRHLGPYFPNESDEIEKMRLAIE